MNHITGEGLGGIRQLLDFGIVRSHNIDLLKDKPQLSTNKLYTRLEARYRYFGSRSVTPGTDYISGDNQGLVYLFDYINRPAKLPSVVSGIKREFPLHVASDANSMTSVGTFRYIPNGVVDGNTYNIKSGECLLLKGTFNVPDFSYKNLYCLIQLLFQQV